MPRAEVGSTKWQANKLKSKGLQRLRWYCQACEKQCRDENGFKCHVASESHVRKMQTIGQDPRKAINEFSNQFKRDFMQLLRTGHGEKKVNVNHFYQEYIHNKEHVHMNATKWASLTEFAKYLGREGLVRVEMDEKNEERGGASALTIQWIDDSPEALRRQEAVRKKERQARGDEQIEQKMIEAQIKRAKRDGLEAEPEDVENDEDTSAGLWSKRNEGEKIALNLFGKKDKSSEPEKPPSPPLTDKDEASEKEASPAETTVPAEKSLSGPAEAVSSTDPKSTEATAKTSLKPISFGAPKPKNVFAAASKKSAFTGGKKPTTFTQQKPMSEAERIMRDELERKRQREERGGNAFKRQRVS